MILSTLGILYAKMTDFESAMIIIEVACSVMRWSNDTNRKSIFPEPFVNLEVILISHRKFESALETINHLNEIDTLINLLKFIRILN